MTILLHPDISFNIRSLFKLTGMCLDGQSICQPQRCFAGDLILISPGATNKNEYLLSFELSVPSGLLISCSLNPRRHPLNSLTITGKAEIRVAKFILWYVVGMVVGQQLGLHIYTPRSIYWEKTIWGTKSQKWKEEKSWINVNRNSFFQLSFSKEHGWINKPFGGLHQID